MIRQSSSTGFVFPGQGSQKVGMLAQLADANVLVKDTFDEASSVLGYDLWALIQEGPEDQLALTHITQPAILTASVAIWRLWISRGGAEPGLMAGHSLGEYSALTCAGALAFRDAVALVHKRGQYMQNAVPVGMGGMSAIIGLEDEKVVAACREAGGEDDVSAVNFNSPGQVVIAGYNEAVTRAGELCKEAGAKRALVLPVSAPFHSRLMKPAADQFANDLAKVSVNPPAILVLQNFGLVSPADPAKIRENLVRQIFSPVPWVDTINRFADAGITQVLEIGPGKVLAGFNKRIQPEMGILSVNDLSTLEGGLAMVTGV